jgi:hypothetical protein
MKSELCAIRLVKVIVLLPTLVFRSCSPDSPDSSFIHLVGSTASIQAPGVVTTSATCPSGQQLIGGRFTTAANSGLVVVTDNYPSLSANTWTVTAQAGPQFSGALVAVAICFTTPNAQLSLSAVTAKTTVNPSTPSPYETVATGTANCPAGSVLTGGGYRVQGLNPRTAYTFNSYISSEGPSSNSAGQPIGWQTTLTYELGVTPTGTVFAICAGSYFSQGSTLTQVTTQDTPPGAGAQTAQVHCPPSTFTSGGGYSVQQSTGTPWAYTVYSSFSDTEGESNWTNKRLNFYEASGWRSDLSTAGPLNSPPTVTISANCIPFPR